MTLTTTGKPVTKEQLISKINELEIKADHYCRTDWVRYTEIKEELQKLDTILLDIYNQENETFLQNIA